MKIILTGFDPFGEDTVNPAWEAVQALKVDDLQADIVKLMVPTVFYKAAQCVQAAIEKEKPDAVLCIGQAGGRYGITPERVAINCDDARIKDNEGQQPVDKPIFEDGAPAYFSSLPIKAMVKKIQACGLPATVSNTAGTFVCNHLMYSVLYTIDKSKLSMIGGFMHVPFIPNQVLDRPNTPSMALADITKGIHAAIEAMIEEGSQA